VGGSFIPIVVYRDGDGFLPGYKLTAASATLYSWDPNGGCFAFGETGR